MATRRMFSKEIVRSDAFTELPLASQALYFQLGMDTDDRGYISNAKAVIRIIQAKPQDLEPLIRERFVLIRGDTLLLQKHFKINNYIQNDRFHETNYIDDLKRLFYEDNGAYTEHETKKRVLNACIQPVSKMDTEDSIGKVSIGKYSTGKDSIGNSSKETSKESDEDDSFFDED